MENENLNGQESLNSGDNLNNQLNQDNVNGGNEQVNQTPVSPVPEQNEPVNPAPVQNEPVNPVPEQNVSVNNPAPVQNVGVNNLAAQGIPNNTTESSNNFFQKNKKLLIIVGAGVLAIILIIVLVGIFGNKKDDISDAYVDWAEKEAKIKDDIISNITYKVESKFSDGKLLVSVKSSNKKPVGLDIPIKFFDENKVQVENTSALFVCVQGGTTLYDVVYAPDHYSSFEIDSENIDAYYDDTSISKCIDYKDKYSAKLTLNAEDESYDVLFTNKMNSTATVSGYVLYYKGGKIYSAGSVMFDSIAANGSAKDDAMLPYDSNYNTVSIDKAEFVLNSVLAK